MESRKLEIEKYLKERVNPLLQPLTYDIIKAKPEDITNFCIEWFTKKQKNQCTSTLQESDTEDHDVIDDLTFKNRISKVQKRNRSAVSAEVYGEFNKRQSFIPKIIEKSEDTKLRILILLRKSVLFTSLDQRDTKIIMAAMEERCFSKGEQVIVEGQDGDVLYMVDQGEFDCFKKINGKQTYLKTYLAGDSFGELALLYNAPRAASIKAKTDGKLFALDRGTFTHIVKQAAMKKKQLYEQVLKKVQLLDCIGVYQRSQISDSLKESKYNQGDYVIRQGDMGDKFFIVVQGKLVAEKQEKDGESKTVYQYKEGDYFGEIALVRNVPRQASVKALTYCKIVWIEREAFKRILGPIEDILKRNEQRYKKYMV